MTAQNPVRRTVTAAALAQQFGVSKRTVQRIIAEPRDEYLARAAALRKQVLHLREDKKLPYKEISERLGIPASSARRITTEARRKHRDSGSDLSQIAS